MKRKSIFGQFWDQMKTKLINKQKYFIKKYLFAIAIDVIKNVLWTMNALWKETRG